MIIDNTISDTWDESCVTLTRGTHEGRTYITPFGEVWAESDGETWLVDEEESYFVLSKNLGFAAKCDFLQFRQEYLQNSENFSDS